MSRGHSPHVELLVSAYLFRAEPEHYRERLSRAVEAEVEGLLYNQLRDACTNALKAPKAEIHLACSAIGDLIEAIGEVPPTSLKPSDARSPYAG